MPEFDAVEYPRVFEFSTEHVMQPGYSFGASFELGLNLIIDGLSTASPRESYSKPTRSSDSILEGFIRGGTGSAP
jgi:hypothetical protein